MNDTENVVSDFLDLVEVMKAIEELEMKKKELRARMKEHVEDMGVPISHNGWTASIRTNSPTQRMNYKELKEEFADIYYFLVVNQVLAINLPKEMTSLVFGRIRGREK